ncbi:MAG: ATP-binding protein [Massilia sp.]
MNVTRILQVGIDSEQDLVAVRQRARQIAALLNYGAQDQVRIATAVSEVARCACGRARGGRAVFTLRQEGAGHALQIDISVGEVATGEQFDAAIVTARRLMDGCAVVQREREAVVVSMDKLLPRGEQIDAARLAALGDALAVGVEQNTFHELRVQNQELAQALAELRERQDELLDLTRELEDTNRGVVALYAEIEEKAEGLRRADAMKSRFLSNTSHELRTPLSSIRALAKLLLDRMDGELTPEQERQVNFIATAATDLSALVNDLLDLAKIEAGKVDIAPTPVDVGALFSSLKGMLRPLVANPEVELVFEPPEREPGLVADEGKIAQILRNFIFNSLKFTERGQVTVSMATLDDGALAFSVTDTGIGISGENLQLIFEEFSQIEHPLQGRAKGTGLGLPLCRKLARMLGGEVEVNSTLGEGSTFSLILPLRYAGRTMAIDEGSR